MRKRANGEGSVYQRRDGLWVAAVSLRSGKRKVVYCHSQAEAVYALHQAQHAKRNRRSLSPQMAPIRDSAQKRRQQVSASTVVKIHRILHRAINDAVRLGRVVRNVGQFVALPPAQKHERVSQVLTVEQAHHLLAVAKDDPLEALYVLALTTGLREARVIGTQME